PQPSDPTINVADEAINEENVSKHSNDLLLSGEDSIKLNELMELCTKLQQRVLDLENTKTTQALEIDNLKRRVKKLEKKDTKRTHKLKRLYKVGLSAKVVSFKDEGLGEEDASKQGRKIHDIDADEDITLKNVHDVDMFGVHDLDGDEVFVEKEVPVKEVSVATITEVDITLAQVLAELKSAKPKTTTTTAVTTVTSASTRPMAKGFVIHEREQAPTPTPIEQAPTPTPIVYPQQPKVQDKEARITREKEEANTILIEEWDDTQAKIDADHQLAEKLQAQEQEELTDAEKATLFVQLLKKTLCSKKSRGKKEQTTNKSSTKKHNVYLSEKHG
ncbi:hypothetical protein Tco_1035182, partial [Tanacetum coccineum]